MASFMVGLRDHHSAYAQVADEGSSPVLVNRFGKTLEQIGQLDDRQKAIVLRWAELGGFTRWHSLAAFDSSFISSTYQNDCQTSFSVMVRFERDLAMSPLNLDINQLRKLVREFGRNLEELRKLTRTQVSKVSVGLVCAGFVNDFLVPEIAQDSSVWSENGSLDAIQPAPFLPPQHPIGPCLPRDNTSSIYDISQPWTDYLNSPGDTEVGLMDFSLSTEAFSENASPMSEQILASDSHIYVDFVSEAGAPSHSTPFSSYPTPDESRLPGSEPGTVIASSTSAFASGVDEGPLCYPTPPFLGVEAFNVRQQPISLESGCPTTSQAESMHGVVGSKEGPSAVPVGHHPSKQTLEYLLRSFDATLDDKRIQGIIDVSALPLLAEDLDKTLPPLVGHWSLYQSLEFPVLGLPAQWRGIDAAADYLRVLDQDQKSPYLNPIAKRIGQVLLYFNYEELCRHSTEGLSCSSRRANTTHILDKILATYRDDPRRSNSLQCRRNRITGYHVRRGKWWWRLAGTLGVGILLLGNTSLVNDMCNKAFTNAQIDAFVAFSQNTRSGTVRRFEASESIVKALMLGQTIDNPHDFFFNSDVGLLRPEEVACIHEEDEQALAVQLSRNTWEAVDAETDAMRKIPDFLDWDSDNTALM